MQGGMGSNPGMQGWVGGAKPDPSVRGWGGGVRLQGLMQAHGFRVDSGKRLVIRPHAFPTA